MTLRLAAVLAAMLLLGGCATVRPWERGPLLRRAMRPVPDATEASMDTHVHRTREAMMGGEVAGGAACGCN